MKFRKKPVEVEATQFNIFSSGTSPEGVCDNPHAGIQGGSHIHTLEGLMNVEHLDWVIKGVKGEFYPCKPDIFEMTYEEVK